MLAPYLQMTTSPETVVVRFRFQINGTSDPDFLVPHAQGVIDIARTGAGVFAITFADKYPVFIGASGYVMAGVIAASHQLIPVGGPAAYVASTGVLTLSSLDLDTPAVTEPTDNDWAYVEAVFCRRSTLAPSGAI